MKHYLTLIKKSDFTDLFKFGYQFIDMNRVVEFDGEIENVRENKEVRDKVFKHLNPYEYSFTVLLIHFQASTSSQQAGCLRIQDVIDIFALDLEAKKEIEISYDPRILIQEPLWKNVSEMVNRKLFIEDARRGAKNIWNILGIQESIHDVEKILPENDLKELARLVLRDIPVTGPLSFWVYLLRYQRHGYFPKDNRGYILDLANVVLNRHKMQNIPAEVIEGTEIYRFLIYMEDLPKIDNLKALITEVSLVNEGKNMYGLVRDYAHRASTASMPIQIALLFLILKNHFSNGFNVSGEESLNLLTTLRRDFPEAINSALYLLGIFLGNTHTYDCLYDTLPLPVFKPQSSSVQSAIDDYRIDEEAMLHEAPFPQPKFTKSIWGRKKGGKKGYTKTKKGHQKILKYCNKQTEVTTYPRGVKDNSKEENARAKIIYPLIAICQDSSISATDTTSKKQKGQTK